MERVLFYTFGIVAILASLWMVTRRNPLTSALSLVVAFVAIAALFALLDANLLFIIQLWVYAGAVMVLVLFVIMLLNLREEEQRLKAIGYGRMLVATALVALGAWKVFGVFGGGAEPRPQVSPDFGSVVAVSERLFTRYLVQFEIVGLLLLTVVVGVVVLAKRRF